MTLTEFLLARIAEDEAATKMTDDYVQEGAWGVSRVLAECEAKRRIVEIATRPEHQSFTSPMVDVLMTLALPYADHDDYREGWKP